MNNFMNKLYVKALVTANMAKNELKKMCEEDEGMDIIAGQDSFPAGCTALEERYSLKETRKRGRIDAKIIKGSFKSGNFTLEYGHRPERKMAQGCTR